VLDLTQRLSAALASRYRIERPLGRGGMATVFLAEDLKHRRRVAIKVMEPEIAAAIGPQRFLREIETAARLTHPHILPLHDSGEADGLLYYVTPYVAGESLRKRLEHQTQLPLEDALRITHEVAGALDYAHRQGVVHRDIKPENVLLEEGHALVADFGIARVVMPSSAGTQAATLGAASLTNAGGTVGTPQYMSPEQIGGSREVDGRSDQYSLACVLYELLAGQAPFTGPTVESIVHQQLSASARPVTDLRPSTPAHVRDALLRALEKIPADRFTTLVEFTRALRGPAAPADARSARARERVAIAVLPLQSLSAESSQAYFAGGLHEELLMQLSKVPALRVISRTSVMGYASVAKPLRQVAEELGVGAVVEGSVQVVASRLRVNVQLIDATTDEHLWAERYDRTLDDAFAIQSEVAERIVEAVGIALGDPGDRDGGQPSAPDAEAYRLYLQGLDQMRRPGYDRRDREAAERLFERALARDPGFALAHAALAGVHGSMLLLRFDPSEARAKRLREQAEAALHLAGDLPQAHVAMGQWHYFVRRDFQSALEEYLLALSGLPGNAEIWNDIGVTHRRLGRMDEALAAFERAKQLAPRAAHACYDPWGTSYHFVRRYADAVAMYDRALELAEHFHLAAVWRGLALVHWKGDVEGYLATLHRTPTEPQIGGFLASVALQRATALLWMRDAARLLDDLRSVRADDFVGQLAMVPPALFAAWSYRLLGDAAAARTSFESALAQLDEKLRELPEDWQVHAGRGLALAGLGCRDQAIEEAHRLRSSRVYQEDAFVGPSVAEERARILAEVGEHEDALLEIERLLAAPAYFSVHSLQLDPRWDPIRGHPKFQALLANYALG